MVRLSVFTHATTRALRGDERIVVFRPDAIGDLVLSLPIATEIKRRHPGVRIDYVVSRACAPLLAHCPHVDRAIPAFDATGRTLSITAMAAALRQGAYDIALLPKSGWLPALSTWLARIPVRAGSWRRVYALFYTHRVDLARKYSGRHEIDLNLRLLQPFGYPWDDTQALPVLRPADPPPALPPGAPARGTPYVVVHPGSRGSAANWPRARYHALIDALRRQVTVVVTGQETAPEPLPHDVVDLRNRTDLAQLIDLLAHARWFVSCSTGPLHVAAALGTRALGLYPQHEYLGPHRWGPRGTRADTLTPPKPATPHRCALRADGSCACMDAIEVDAVLDRALQALGEAVVSSR